VAETEADAVRWLSHNPDAWDLVIVDLFFEQRSRHRHKPSTSTTRKKQLVLSNYDLIYDSAALNSAQMRAFDNHEIDSLIDFCIDLIPVNLENNANKKGLNISFLFESPLIDQSIFQRNSMSDRYLRKGPFFP
jgi:hypothetical protein